MTTEKFLTCKELAHALLAMPEEQQNLEFGVFNAEHDQYDRLKSPAVFEIVPVNKNGDRQFDSTNLSMARKLVVTDTEFD